MNNKERNDKIIKMLEEETVLVSQSPLLAKDYLINVLKIYNKDGSLTKEFGGV